MGKEDVREAVELGGTGEEGSTFSILAPGDFEEVLDVCYFGGHGGGLLRRRGVVGGLSVGDSCV